MKKFLIVLVMFLSCFILFGCKKDKNKITIVEVAHSVFYAPQYVALELGYFEEEGLDVSIVNANGADKVMAALLSKDAQIGLMGPEASIYVYNEGQKNYAVNFAQLTKKDGSFIVARENNDDFNVEMLKGKSILGGRKGGMPEMTLEYVLKNNGLIIDRDNENIINNGGVNVRTDVQFAAMAGAFTSGEGDYTTLFEPTATLVEKENKGYVVASVGELSGDVPYTAYSCLKEYMEDNEDILEKFTRAIYKGQKWVKTHTAREIAEKVSPYFEELSIEDLEKVMQRHIDIDAWKDEPCLYEDDFNKLMDIMELAGELTKRAPYEKLVNNKFAERVK